MQCPEREKKMFLAKQKWPQICDDVSGCAWLSFYILRPFLFLSQRFTCYLQQFFHYFALAHHSHSTWNNARIIFVCADCERWNDLLLLSRLLIMWNGALYSSKSHPSINRLNMIRQSVKSICVYNKLVHRYDMRAFRNNSHFPHCARNELYFAILPDTM